MMSETTSFASSQVRPGFLETASGLYVSTYSVLIFPKSYINVLGPVLG